MKKHHHLPQYEVLGRTSIRTSQLNNQFIMGSNTWEVIFRYQLRQFWIFLKTVTNSFNNDSIIKKVTKVAGCEVSSAFFVPFSVVFVA